MSQSVWRWLAALLIVVNLVLLVLHLRGGTASDQPEPTIPALDPKLPRLQLVQDLPNGQGFPAGQCFSIGPLSSSLAQQRAEDRLRATALQVRSRQTQSDRDRGWWVFLPAGSRTEAMALTRQLAEDGQDDFFVVTRGDMENVVSVGLYENIDNARAPAPDAGPRLSSRTRNPARARAAVLGGVSGRRPAAIGLALYSGGIARRAATRDTLLE